MPKQSGKHLHYLPVDPPVEQPALPFVQAYQQNWRAVTSKVKEALKTQSDPWSEVMTIVVFSYSPSRLSSLM